MGLHEANSDGPELIAFVAMSFRVEDEPSLMSYYRAMRRAVETAEVPIELKRIDEVRGCFELSKEIMDQIDRSHIVIADLTMNSNNVYLELGYAMGIGKRVILTARRGTRPASNIRSWKMLFYENAIELEDKLVPELQAAYEDRA